MRSPRNGESRKKTTGTADCPYGTGPRLCDYLRQRGAVRLDFPNRFNDVIHVPAVGQEQILGHGNRRRADLPVAFQLMEALAIGFQPLGAKETLEPARVDRLVEQTVEILFVITARTRDAFGVERFEELVASQTVEVVCVVSEWIEMPDRCLAANAPAGCRESVSGGCSSSPRSRAGARFPEPACRTAA